MRYYMSDVYGAVSILTGTLGSAWPSVWAALALLVLVAVLMVYMLWTRNRRLPMEAGRTLRYEAHCGLVIGYLWQHPFPFARLSIYDDFLVIKHIRATILPLREITEVKPYRALFRGIRIWHKGSRLGQPLWISLRNPAEAEAVILRMIRAKAGSE